MPFTEKILTLQDVDRILAFEQERLRREGLSPTEATFAEWDAPWRRESLDHYAQTGWSFFVADAETGAIQGYLLGQMFLFYRNHTQTLWIEHIAGVNPQGVSQLVDIGVRWARDKHLQRVFFQNRPLARDWEWPVPAVLVEKDEWMVKTTKDNR